MEKLPRPSVSPSVAIAIEQKKNKTKKKQNKKKQQINIMLVILNSPYRSKIPTKLGSNCTYGFGGVVLFITEK